MKVAILGATGAVGQQMLKCLIEREIRCELVLLASAKSEGIKYPFFDQQISVKVAKEDSFIGCDYVLGAVSADQARYFVPFIKAANAIFIDNSSAFRLDSDVPLIVAEINGSDIKNHQGIIANPNCSTIITCMAVYGIHKLSPIQAMIASTYQAVSGAGVEGINELENQIKDPNYPPNVFPYQIAYNCIPSIGSALANDYTDEEMKLQYESQKILHDKNLKVSCTCVRIPVLRSHSISVCVITKDHLAIDDVVASINSIDNIQVIDDLQNQQYPMPILTSDKDDVMVGRIRHDLVIDNAINLWCCGDQIRKGAATNAIQILQLLIKDQ